VTVLSHRRFFRPLTIAVIITVPALLAGQAALAASSRSGSRSARPVAARTAVTASCARTHVLFCEDFQALPVGAAMSPKWAADTQQGTLTVEPLHAGSTQKVLHAHTVGNGRALLTISGLKAPGNSYYGRMFLNIAALPTAPDFAHFMIVQVTGAGSKEMVRPVGGQFVNKQFLKNGGPGRSLWGIGADGGPTGDWTNWKESATAVAGRWQCIEWTMHAPDHRVQLWINGVSNPDLVVTTKNHGGKAVPFILPAPDKIQIGWWLFQPMPAPIQFDVRLDDIALSSNRLGCPKTHL
jgi:hypothetical protein